MGKSPDGPFGPLIGKAGPLIGYILNGQPILRARPHKSNKPLTIPRKNNCGKMTVLSDFISYMTFFLRITFGPEAQGTVKNWHNLVIQYNNPHAIKGYYPNLEIDYPKVVLSRGNLRPAVNPKVELVEDQVKFSWDVASEDKSSKEQVMMLLYFPDDHQVVYETSGAKRKAGFDVLPPLNKDQKNKPMEAFISFVSEDRLSFANSVHIGSLNGSAAVVSKEELVVAAAKNEANDKVLDIARNFKKMGIAAADIAKGTGLSMEEIERL